MRKRRCRNDSNYKILSRYYR